MTGLKRRIEIFAQRRSREPITDPLEASAFLRDLVRYLKKPRLTYDPPAWLSALPEELVHHQAVAFTVQDRTIAFDLFHPLLRRLPADAFVAGPTEVGHGVARQRLAVHDRIVELQTGSVLTFPGTLCHWPSFSCPSWPGPRALMLVVPPPHAVGLTGWIRGDRDPPLAAPESDGTIAAWRPDALGERTHALRVSWLPPERRGEAHGAHDLGLSLDVLLDLHHRADPGAFPFPRTASKPDLRRSELDGVLALDFGATQTCLRWRHDDLPVADATLGRSGWVVLAGDPEVAASYELGSELASTAPDHLWPSRLVWRRAAPLEDEAKLAESVFPFHLAIPCEGRDKQLAELPPFKWPGLVAHELDVEPDVAARIARRLLEHYLRASLWTVLASWWLHRRPSSLDPEDGRGTEHRRWPIPPRIELRAVIPPRLMFTPEQRFEDVFREAIDGVLEEISTSTGLAISAAPLRSEVDLVRERIEVTDPPPGIFVVADLGGLDLSITAWTRAPRSGDTVVPRAGTFTMGGERCLEALAFLRAPDSSRTAEALSWLRRCIRTQRSFEPADAARVLRSLAPRATGLVALFAQAMRLATPGRALQSAPVYVTLAGQGWKLLAADRPNEERGELARSRVEGALARLLTPGLPADLLEVEFVDKPLVTDQLLSEQAPRAPSGGPPPLGPPLGASFWTPDGTYRPYFLAGEETVPAQPTVHDAEPFMRVLQTRCGWSLDRSVRSTFAQLKDRAPRDEEEIRRFLETALGWVDPRDSFDGCVWTGLVNRYGDLWLLWDMVRGNPPD